MPDPPDVPATTPGARVVIRVLAITVAVAALAYAALDWWARRRVARIVREWPERRRQILGEAAAAFGQTPVDPTLVDPVDVEGWPAAWR